MLSTTLFSFFVCILYFLWTNGASAFVVGRKPNQRFHETSCSSFSEQQTTKVLQPPPYLNDLKIGQSVDLEDSHQQIVKLSHDPNIFLLKRFLDDNDCQLLMETASSVCNMSAAETRSGIVQHRTQSQVGWLGEDDDHLSPEASLLIGYTQYATRHFFLPHASNVQTERLQVVWYEPTGKFDLHHDGCQRTLTVLTYLNGVAGTWFPYVNATDADIPTMKLENQGMLKGKQPGRDGLLFASTEDLVDNDELEFGNVVRVQAGDAIVFYNYQHHDEFGTILSWKTLHCGLPATSTKWIATNWLRAWDD